MSLQGCGGGSAPFPLTPAPRESLCPDISQRSSCWSDFISRWQIVLEILLKLGEFCSIAWLRSSPGTSKLTCDSCPQIAWAWGTHCPWTLPTCPCSHWSLPPLWPTPLWGSPLGRHTTCVCALSSLKVERLVYVLGLLLLPRLAEGSPPLTDVLMRPGEKANWQAK